ncbi:hypothetical protein LT493_31165 [Streptomyces tricolor]|nr:hypothetical protein [Streptomyces tricolor]
MTRAFQGDLPDAVRLCEDVRRVCEDHGGAVGAVVRAVRAGVRGLAGLAIPAPRAELLTDCRTTCTRSASLGDGALDRAAGPGDGDAGRCGGGGGAPGAAGRMWPSVGLPLFGLGVLQTPRTSCARRRPGRRWATERSRRWVRRGRGWTGDGGGWALRPRRPAAAGAADAAGQPCPAPAGKREPAASPTRKGGETAG